MKAISIGQKSAFFLMASLAGALLTACNDTGFTAAPSPQLNSGGDLPPGGLPSGPKTVVDSYNVNLNPGSKVDMLFCVDNSGSMGDDQALLGDTFSAFIDGFVRKDVDFQIGIITSDIASTDPNYWQARLPGYVNPNLGRLLTRTSTERYLTKSTPDYENRFKANVNVGTAGSGQEQCLGSILAAIDAKMLGIGGPNSGFFRDDALLSFIIVSDEDETITNGESPATRLKNLKDRVIALRGSASRGFRFDFVINKSEPKPATPPAPNAGLRPYPEILYQAAEYFTALTYDIKTNFANALLQISDGIVNQAQGEFKLSSSPSDPSKIVVKLGSQFLAYNGANGFIYHADRNTIELQGTAVAQAPGLALVITYDTK